ncbi:hypothetical protein V1520DRAFT_330935 [Lipomyces starkeyi]|uniref:Nucleolar protein Dnt1-like N-terminal domain-containing protein n=1 Tax=Lipomyces starkeyi NRRL Y-11557 TaxID=675824 RepID=A0A1E3PWV9_LIPST|nr:hypothetical protein LIPSTDRAFT_120285 [Lipomyces starkeyi NRRL Y-11557]
MTNTSVQLVRLQVHVGHNAAGGYPWLFDNPTSLQTTPTLLTGSPLPKYGPSRRKFIHITKPSTSIRQLKDELMGRYERIYHQYLDIESIRDEHECDLDDDYSVSQIFSDGGIVRVFTNNSMDIASPLTASERSPNPTTLEVIVPLADGLQKRTPTPMLQNMSNMFSDRQPTGTANDVVLLSPSNAPMALRNVSPASPSRTSASPELHKAKRARIDEVERSSSPELMVLDSQGQLVSGAEDSQPTPSRTTTRFRAIEKPSDRKANVEAMSAPETIIPDSQVPDLHRPPRGPVTDMPRTPLYTVASKTGEETEPMNLTTKLSSNGTASQLSATPKHSTEAVAKHEPQNLATKSSTNGAGQKSVKLVKKALESDPGIILENGVSRPPMETSSKVAADSSMPNGMKFARDSMHTKPTKENVLVKSETIKDDDGNEPEHVISEEETTDDSDSVSGSETDSSSERSPSIEKPAAMKPESAAISQQRSKAEMVRTQTKPERDKDRHDSHHDDFMEVGEGTDDSDSDVSDSESSGSTDSENGGSESTKSDALKAPTRTPTTGGLQTLPIKPEPVSVQKPASLAAIVKAPLLEKRVPSFRSLSELAKLGVPDVRESTTGIRAIQSQITNDQKRAQTNVVAADSDTNDGSDSDSGSSSDSDDSQSDDESGIPVNRRASGVMSRQGDEKKKRYSSGFRALIST